MTSEMAEPEPEPKTCSICTEVFEYIALGSCGQQYICSTCVARSRFLKRTTKCDYCRKNHDFVFVTKPSDALNRRFIDFSKFSPNPKEGLVGTYWYNADTKAFFDDFDEYTRIKDMCKICCTSCGETKFKTKFKCIGDLMTHLFEWHKQYLCHICVVWKARFICEQKLFTKDQLDQHIRTGDSEVDGTLVERDGFSGHPFCELCKNPYFGDEDVYIHMARFTQGDDDCSCHICSEMIELMGDMQDHFILKHIREDDGYWLDNFSIVRGFNDDIDLELHNEEMHHQSASSSPLALDPESSAAQFWYPNTDVPPPDHPFYVQQPYQNQSSSIQNSNQYRSQAQVRFPYSSASSALSDHARTEMSRTYLSLAPPSSSDQFWFPRGDVSSSDLHPLSEQQQYLRMSETPPLAPPRTNVSPSGHPLSIQQQHQDQSSSIQNSNQYGGFPSSSASYALSDHDRIDLNRTPLDHGSSSAQFPFPLVSSSDPHPHSVQQQPNLSQAEASFSSFSETPHLATASSNTRIRLIGGSSVDVREYLEYLESLGLSGFST